MDGSVDVHVEDLASEGPVDTDAEDVGESGEQEFEEWGGMETDPKDQSAEEGHHPGTKPKKPPTGEELRTIKEATDLFRSSSFKLQIDALLPNIRPKASRIPPLDRFLLSLHSFLGGLPSVPPQHPLEGARRLLKKNVSVPYSVPLPSEDTNWKVGFEKPSDIAVIGSWGNKISVKAKDGIRFGVDIAVEMPDSLFQEKDYLNGRYFHKRAFYLATIAAAIKSSKSGLNVDVLYDSYSDDPRLTKLVLVPKQDNSQIDFTKLHAQVCVIPVLSPQSPIVHHRLSPSHSNIRINTISGDDSTVTNLPTPIYNSALLRALTPKPQLLATYTLQAETPSFGDALTLLRVWANQRGYGPGSRICVRGFESMGSWWGALLALLIAGEERAGAPKSSKRKPLGRGLSSYQLFRAALDFLAKHDYEKDPVFLRTKDGKHRYAPEEYQQNHDAVFVDSTSTLNLLAGVPLGSLELLRHDAQKTLETLDESSFSGDPFIDVFLVDHRDLPARFDTLLRIDLSSASPLNPSIQLTMDTGSTANALIASLTYTLRRGLGNRTKAATVLSSPSSPRSLSQAHPSNPSVIYIGLIHHPQNAFRLVDHGPAADDEDEVEKQRFRDFWGEKAELRRFKDGRIIESVVWDVKTADERAHIPGMIVRHLLNRHFGIEEDKIQTWQTSFDSVLRLPEAISSLYLGSGVTTGSKGAITAFDNLVKRIKALDDDLPLALLNVSPISEQLRYTSVFSPVPLPPSLASTMPQTARYIAPINIVLEFEKSSKWPDDLKAIQKIKLAFFERIASVLMSSTEGLKAIVVVGDGISTSEILDQASLEIVTPEGWAFSARIWHDREATLLDRIIDNKKALPHVTQKPEDHKRGREYRDAVEAKEVYTRRFIHAPRHHRAIASLSHQYSAYTGTVRLAKRWLASHWLLHGHISEEAVEILCASLFIGDGKDVGADPDVKIDERASIPGSKERGFAAFIALLKGWTWTEGLFVPLYGKDAIALAGSPQSSGVKASAESVWNISTELDKGGRIWTSRGPDLVIARRVNALAKATWDLLQGVEQGPLNVKSLFVHPTDDYDIIVRLDHGSLPRYFHNVTVDASLLSRRGKYANLLEDPSGGIRPGFDPARMLFDDLQRVYAHTFKIFFDPFGGDRFGVVWDPTLKQPRPFRVLGEFSSIPIKKESEKAKDKGLVSLNEASVLSELERLGSGLVIGMTVRV
ncbi:Nrap protein [Collybia nuda]|uniref:U3 small nucleolar RNA-associated protein 22 n=1 Tax=Collybia nuda TaxID=64659 RepID=A0A9P5Y735_9AGAR|nr:Nrap protein [Collybia nuda]